MFRIEVVPFPQAISNTRFDLSILHLSKSRFIEMNPAGCSTGNPTYFAINLICRTYQMNHYTNSLNRFFLLRLMFAVGFMNSD